MKLVYTITGEAAVNNEEMDDLETAIADLSSVLETLRGFGAAQIKWSMEP
jgi:hypothetical protein